MPQCQVYCVIHICYSLGRTKVQQTYLVDIILHGPSVICCYLSISETVLKTSISFPVILRRRTLGYFNYTPEIYSWLLVWLVTQKTRCKKVACCTFETKWILHEILLLLSCFEVSHMCSLLGIPPIECMNCTWSLCL